MNWFKRRSAPAPAPEPEVRRGINRSALVAIGPERRRDLTPINPAPVADSPFTPARPMVKGVPAMAMDDALTSGLDGIDYHEGIGFFGYPFLAELAQRPEYRRMSETLAKEMAREWLVLVSTGDDGDGPNASAKARDIRKRYREALEAKDPDAQEEIKAEWAALLDDQEMSNPKAEKLKAIDAELKRLGAQAAFRRCAELDGFFGRGHIYLDTGRTDDPTELKVPLTIDRRKIRKGGLKRLTVVEPMWCYPLDYNAADPLKPNFFRPQTWNVNGKTIHATRLLTFVGREMPDLLKPAYAFGGLSLSQMAKPYVDNWLRTRQSVSDLVHAFSIPVLKTDISAALSGNDTDGSGIDDLLARVETLNRCRDNRGAFVIQKQMSENDPGEDFEIVSVPIAGLNDLQSAAQEQMAAVSGIPLVKLLGTTPSGLNASSDGEIRVFYDFISAMQEQMFSPQFDRLLKIVQLSLFGEIDPEIGFEWSPLWQLDETAEAASRKADADIDCEYFDRGILSAEEIRRKIAADKGSPYASLDVDDLPEEPEDGGEFDPDRDMLSGGEGGDE